MSAPLPVDSRLTVSGVRQACFEKLIKGGMRLSMGDSDLSIHECFFIRNSQRPAVKGEQSAGDGGYVDVQDCTAACQTYRPYANEAESRY